MKFRSSQEQEHNFKECDEKSEWNKAANVCWTHSSLLASVALILFQTGEAYSNLDLTKVKCDNNKLAIVEN